VRRTEADQSHCDRVPDHLLDRPPAKDPWLPHRASIDVVTEIVPVTADRWLQLADFFGPSGAYGHCWCTYFRQSGKEYEAGARDKGAGNRRLLLRLTADGQVPGLLALRGGQPVGWVSVALREEYARVLRSPLVDRERLADDRVWSVVCFWVPREHRGSGVASALLAGAVDYAAANDASVVEGYPIDTAGGRRAATSVYQGTLELFLRAGFTESYRRKHDRPVVTLAVDS